MEREHIDWVDSVSMDVLEQHNKAKWQLIKEKIQAASYHAIVKGDQDLAITLHHAQAESVEQFYEQMNRHGYTFEIQMPQQTIKTNGRHFFFDFTGMKLVIWKKVLEV